MFEGARAPQKSGTVNSGMRKNTEDTVEIAMESSKEGKKQISPLYTDFQFLLMAERNFQ
jgi:hypothetical protein